jgi:hypothetical protein
VSLRESRARYLCILHFVKNMRLQRASPHGIWGQMDIMARCEWQHSVHEWRFWWRSCTGPSKGMPVSCLMRLVPPQEGLQRPNAINHCFTALAGTRRVLIF